MNPPSKYSHQREAIINCLKTKNNHPTAEEIYHNIREDIPNISLGTVYRNLNQLADAGIILRFSGVGKTDHYDACIEPHCHFVCRSCGIIKDIFMNPTNTLIQSASQGSNDTINDVSVLFYGTCENCK